MKKVRNMQCLILVLISIIFFVDLVCVSEAEEHGTGLEFDYVHIIYVRMYDAETNKLIHQYQLHVSKTTLRYVIPYTPSESWTDGYNVTYIFDKDNENNNFDIDESCYENFFDAYYVPNVSEKEKTGVRVLFTDGTYGENGSYTIVGE